MGKKMTKAGAELRRAIRADIDANPDIDHKLLRSKHATSEAMVESALSFFLPKAIWIALVLLTRLVVYIGDHLQIVIDEIQLS